MRWLLTIRDVICWLLGMKVYVRHPIASSLFRKELFLPHEAVIYGK